MPLDIFKPVRKIWLIIWRLFSHFFDDHTFLRIKYFIWFLRWPNLSKPKLLNEKIMWRMLYDRRPVFQQLCDKVAVHDYVKDKGLEAYLPLHLYVTEDPTTIDINYLPNSFVLKPNHASGLIRIIYEKDRENWDEIVQLCKDWLKVDFYRKSREWQYKNIPRKILVEEFLGRGTRLPTDYKFHCFDGEPQFITVISHRLSPQKRKGWFNLDWKPVGQDSLDKISTIFPKPDRLIELTKVARLFADGFDYIRVDLYMLPKRILLGELTPTPLAGVGHRSRELQERYGALWKLNISGDYSYPSD